MAADQGAGFDDFERATSRVQANLKAEGVALELGVEHHFELPLVGHAFGDFQDFDAGLEASQILGQLAGEPGEQLRRVHGGGVTETEVREQVSDSASRGQHDPEAREHVAELRLGGRARRTESFRPGRITERSNRAVRPLALQQHKIRRYHDIGVKDQYRLNRHITVRGPVTTTLRCFGCAESFSPADLRPVGDGWFCRACFEGLLAEGGGSAAVKEPVPAAVLAPAAPKKKCTLCELTFHGEPFLEIGDLVICPACEGAIVPDMPAESSTPVEQPPARGAAQANGDSVEIEHTPGTGTVHCTGCGRPMPGLGSYHLVDGKPQCPACFARAAHVQHVTREANPAKRCDCCQRPLHAGHQRMERGFFLCLSCCDSDLELALGIARARHRAWLMSVARGGA